MLPKRVNNATLSLRRGFASQHKPEKKLSKEEVEAALDKANESMRAYYSYPPEKVMAAKKARFQQRHMDKSFYFQVGLGECPCVQLALLACKVQSVMYSQRMPIKYMIGMSLLCTFLITPFLGRIIAYDEEFKNKYIPEWYDYTIEKPKSAWTREELHQQVMLLRRELHERAIAGEFTPEKLDDMRRTMAKKPEKEEYAHFAQLHPGVDVDEDLEDD